MDMGRFAKGFERESRFSTVKAPSTERPAGDLMQVSRKWSSFFSHALTQLLDGNKSYGPEYLEQHLEDYGDLSTRQHFLQLPPLLRASATANPEDAIFINNANFHTMSQAMLPVWNTVLLPERYGALQNSDLSFVQAQLAVRGVELARLLPTIPTSLVDAAVTGQVTEIDAAITMLEVIKNQSVGGGSTGLAIVPSPSLFEGNPTHQERSSDLILIDTSASQPQARGIQTKTTPSRHHNYDPKYVSMVVGATDLGNNVPGLISSDFLLSEEASEAIKRASKKGTANTISLGLAQALRSPAKSRLELSSNPYTNRAAVAAKKIGERVLADLYQDSDQAIA